MQGPLFFFRQQKRKPRLPNNALAVGPEAGNLDGIVSSCFQHCQSGRADPAKAEEAVQRNLTRSRTVRRVQKEQIQTLACWPQIQNGSSAHGGPFASVQRRKVLTQHCKSPAILLDEQAVRGTARQRFQPQGTRTCEQVRHAQLLEGAQPAHQHVEKRFANAVGCRPCYVAPRCRQSPSAPLAGDNPHQRALAGRLR